MKLNILYSVYRIVRNKAAERAKVSYNMNTSGGNNQQQQQGPGSPDGSQGGNLSASQTNSLVNNVMSQSSGGQLSGPMGVPLGSGGGAHQGHVESSLLHRPSYSINGILGIPQPDANANSIAGIKRKREDGGKDNLQFHSKVLFLLYLYILYIIHTFKLFRRWTIT